MPPRRHCATTRQGLAPTGQAGVSLIELMVGLTIGLLAVLVITQVMRVYESQKRSTTGGADAQVNGAVALHSLQREIQMAGWGLTNSGAAGCEVRYKLLTQAADKFTATGVEIHDGADGAPDELTLRRGKSKDFALPIKIKGHFRSATAFDLDGAFNVGIQTGDLLMAVPRVRDADHWCTLFNVTQVSNTQIQHATGSAGTWNHDGAINPDTGLPLYPGATGGDVAYEPGSHVIVLGQLEMTRVRLQDQRLQWLQRTFSAGSTTSVWPTTWTDQHPQIVDFQAVYGKDTSVPRDNIADVWNADAPTSADGWAGIVAVRIAVVAQSTHYEKDLVTPARPADCSAGPPATGNYPVWSPAGDGNWVCLGIAPGTVEDADFGRHFRYKVFETVVPLRNMLWQS